MIKYNSHYKNEIFNRAQRYVICVRGYGFLSFAKNIGTHATLGC